VIDERRIEELVEQTLSSERTPEEVCRDCPELLPFVRERCAQVRNLVEQLDVVLPASPPGGAPPLEDALPRIPGYEISGLLGRGGVGVVYRARQPKLEREVALKMLLAGEFASPHELERFCREARAVASLGHRNVVQVYDVSELDGRPFFTMELVSGGSLAQRIAGAPQAAAAAAELVETLARAMDFAHRKGIVHRDLKPGNVLLAPDGTAKIVDFGLARRLEGGESLTSSGAILGTPGYMAPEQVRGETAGPAADVYALGGILYEMLTGRPPFRSETPVATQLQVLTSDPVRPSLLNARVPRDLETICLECLRKEARARYPSAEALADDLGRFRRGEPITARRASAVERGLKWIRRRPATATLLAVGALALILLFSGALWLVSSRAGTEREAERDLQEVAEAHRRSDWGGGSRALDRAQLRLGSAPGFADLHRRLDQARREAQLVQRLETIRMTRAGWYTDADFARTDAEYALAFREAQLFDVEEPGEAVAARLAQTDIPTVLVNALDDWVFCTQSGTRRSWLISVANLAFPDPAHWRERAADPRTWEDRAAIAELASSVPLEGVSVASLVAFGNRLMESTELDAAPFLLRVQRIHPEDFFVYVFLGRAMTRRGDYAEALRYYQAAEVLRPDTQHVHEGVAWAYDLSGRSDEAIVEYRKVASMRPTWQSYVNLAMPLWNVGRYPEACDALEQALRLQTDSAGVSAMVDLRARLGDALLETNRREEAEAKYREALALCGSLPFEGVYEQVRGGLFKVMARGGAWEQGIADIQAGVAGRPGSIQAWYGYAELCAYLGRDDDYRDARAELLSLFGESTEPLVCESVARACLLLPASSDELQRARALIDRALAGQEAAHDWRYPYFLLTRALAELRAGGMDRALSIVRDREVSGVLFPAPKLVEAIALHRTGKIAEARHALAQAATAVDWPARSVDWTPRSAESRESWIYHALRREAEGLILPGAAAFFRGERVPEDDDERLALTAACQDRGFHVKGARLWADVLASTPALLAEHGFDAAAAAALAGCGTGVDTQGLGEAERAAFRKQAVVWLNGQLDACEQKFAKRRQEDITSVHEALRPWRTSWKLVPLRDPAERARLPSDEQEACRKLWTRLGVVLERRH
jgi:eukaryotic-like serine/threonine-protein kinase